MPRRRKRVSGNSHAVRFVKAAVFLVLPLKRIASHAFIRQQNVTNFEVEVRVPGKTKPLPDLERVCPRWLCLEDTSTIHFSFCLRAFRS